MFNPLRAARAARIAGIVVASLVLVLASAALRAQDADDARDELVDALLPLAESAAEAGANVEARRIADVVLALDANNRDAQRLSDRLADATNDLAWERVREIAADDAAGMSRSLVSVFADEWGDNDANRLALILHVAWGLDPEAVIAEVDTALSDALDDDVEEALLLMRIASAAVGARSEPAQRWEDAVVGVVGKTQAVQIQARTHTMQYLLSLPEDWEADAKRDWPVVIACEGSWGRYGDYMDELIAARGDRDAIIVVPITVANVSGDPDAMRALPYPADVIRGLNGGWAMIDFDRAGALAVLDDVQTRFNGESEAGLTGFSAGSFVFWRVLLTASDRIASAVLCSGQFDAQLTTGVDEVASPDTPVHLYLGTRDPVYDQLNAMWPLAAESCGELEMTALSREDVDGEGHVRFAEQAFGRLWDAIGE